MGTHNMQMDSKYQHESIHLYIMESRTRGLWSGNETGVHGRQSNEVGIIEKHENNSDNESCHGAEEIEDCQNVQKTKQLVELKIGDGDLSDWQGRRYRSMAARLVEDVISYSFLLDNYLT